MYVLFSIFYIFTFNVSASVNNLHLKNKTLPPLNLKQSIQIDVHIPTATSIKLADVISEIKLARKIWAQCSIEIQVRNIFTSDLKKEIAQDFESIAFNQWRISDFEKEIFQFYSFNIPTIHYVDYLDWSYDKSGTRAISYPAFLHTDLKKISPEDQKFYLQKMQGSAILSSLRDTSTLAHELGHSVFNLRHADTSKNLMIGSVMGKRRHFQLNKEQCEKASSQIAK